MHATRKVFAHIMSELIGYARVSSTSQNLDTQMDALQQAGCDKIFTDKDSGAKSSRPGWDDLLGYIRAGDTLVITELSRMSRSLVHLARVKCKTARFCSNAPAGPLGPLLGAALTEQGVEALRRKRFGEDGHARLRQKRLHVGIEGIPGQKHDARTELGLAALERLVKAWPVAHRHPQITQNLRVRPARTGGEGLLAVGHALDLIARAP